MRREWIEIAMSGKSDLPLLSPSMRREWIEMYLLSPTTHAASVSLHAEGVD